MQSLYCVRKIYHLVIDQLSHKFFRKFMRLIFAKKFIAGKKSLYLLLSLDRANCSCMFIFNVLNIFIFNYEYPSNMYIVRFEVKFQKNRVNTCHRRSSIFGPEFNNVN